MTDLTLKQALINWDTLAAYGGIIRNDCSVVPDFGPFQTQEKDAEGRRVAGWLGALGPSISCVNDVPTSIMPRWLASLTDIMDEGTSNDRWMGFMVRYRAVLGRMDSLSPQASDRARDYMLIRALEIALPHDKADVVQPTITLLHRRLGGEEVAAEMSKAAESARAVRADPNNAKDSSGLQCGYAAEAESAKAALCAANANVRWAANAATASEAWGKSTFSFGRRQLASVRTAWDEITDACLSALEKELGLLGNPAHG
ncbi:MULTISPECIES: hypothetical protein [unclassified Hyphomonas]|uniref:hypothetical protein n=1 Tax=unclassified Hyphomonas TaxID=2630699 RepID=UPI000EC53C7C|nr:MULTISPECIES: hypothetical protein [unclassified Hyphomonas]HAO35852.1 hypothetical protein [Hyphomonas sp.]